MSSIWLSDCIYLLKLIIKGSVNIVIMANANIIGLVLSINTDTVISFDLGFYSN